MTGLNKFGMESQPTTKPGAKIITISAVELNHKSNYQDFGRYVEVDLAITGDAEATLPELIEAVKRLMTADRKRALRGARREARRGRTSGPASAIANWPRSAWDASPISTARLVGGTVGADQERRLVAGVERPLRQLLAHAPVGLQQALSVHRRAGRRGHRLPSRRRRWARRWPTASMAG